jgi:hypothetical protein
MRRADLRLGTLMIEAAIRKSRQRIHSIAEYLPARIIRRISRIAKVPVHIRIPARINARSQIITTNRRMNAICFLYPAPRTRLSVTDPATYAYRI